MPERYVNEAFLLIGGNIGNRLQYLSRAREILLTLPLTIERTSAIYETEAWGIEAQEKFLNQVLRIKTGLSPTALLSAVLSIEEKMGRKRQLKYGPRTIDIDILFYNKEIIHSTKLNIPHPQLQNRRFVLVPLVEIAPELEHPVLHKNLTELLNDCNDPLDVYKFNE
jgi:2-amino-4-hydroxy-6-hydroxymethyldihydropteridine diphosphokinase